MTNGTRKDEGAASRSGRFYPRKDEVHIVQKAEWAPEPVGTGAENLVSHRDSDRPARSQPLYRQQFRPTRDSIRSGNSMLGKSRMLVFLKVSLLSPLVRC